MEFQTDPIVKATLLNEALKLGFEVSNEIVQQINSVAFSAENSSEKSPAELQASIDAAKSAGDLDALTKLAECLYRSKNYSAALEVAREISALIGDEARSEDALPSLWAVIFISIVNKDYSAATDAASKLKNSIEKIHFKTSHNNPYPYITQRIWLLNSFAILAILEDIDADSAKLSLIKLIKDDRYIRIIHQNTQLYDFIIYSFITLFKKGVISMQNMRNEAMKLADLEHESMTYFVQYFYNLVIKSDIFCGNDEKLEKYLKNQVLLISREKEIIESCEEIKNYIKKDVFEDL